MGGMWERMIRTVRQILLNILPSRPLDDDCLLTLMVEVEDIVNSRPLTEVNPEAEGNFLLTPNHLLRLNVEPNLPPMNTDEKDGFRAADRFRQVQFLADTFWQPWIVEYPRSIITRTKWHRKKRNFLLGDVVLLIEDSTSRQHWPLARAIRIFSDQHGVVRSVEVTVSYGKTFKRPIHKNWSPDSNFRRRKSTERMLNYTTTEPIKLKKKLFACQCCASCSSLGGGGSVMFSFFDSIVIVTS